MDTTTQAATYAVPLDSVIGFEVKVGETLERLGRWRHATVLLTVPQIGTNLHKVFGIAGAVSAATPVVPESGESA